MARPNKKELDKSITKIKKTKIKDTPTLSVKEDDTVIYDKLGQKQEALASDQIMAKYYLRNGIPQYVVKVNSKNELWNPFDTIYVDNSYRMSRTYGNQVYKLVPASLQCFNNYLKFLQSKTIGYLNLAQRELN